MLRRTAVLFLIGILPTGCANNQWSLPRDRPPTIPEPIGVQEEIRDARYFLAYPDQTLGPSTELLPRTSRQSLSSD